MSHTSTFRHPTTLRTKLVKCASLFNDVKRIKSIDFGVLSAAAATAQSVCHVTCKTVYEKSMPKPNGLQDTRMGTADRRMACATCGHNMLYCSGHPGHRTLNVPVYHYFFVDKVYRVLKVVCYFCSTLLIDTSALPHDFHSMSTKNKFLYTTSQLRVSSKCPHCQAPQPKYVNKKRVISLTWPDTTGLQEEELAVTKKKFTAYTAWVILRNVKQSDVQLLGLDVNKTSLESLLLRTLVIPPPCIRPTIKVAQGSRSVGVDNLTSMLKDILKIDIAIEEETKAREQQGIPYLDQIANPSDTLLDLWQKLQDNINYYFAQDAPTTTKGGTVVSKKRNLAKRLKSKDGRFRGNLNGKRVNQSARTVISPEAELDVNQLGIPEQVALTLTVSEIVSPLNYQEMMNTVRKGAGVLGGAKAIVKRNGKTIRLDMVENPARLVLELGDKVERYLRDGDEGVFNRQPSLHKLSLMGMKLKVIPGKTFRLPVPATTCFNADFDGDEMNLHIAQDIQSKTEILELMALPKHIVTPQNSEPITSLKQDSLLGIYLLGLPGVKLTRPQYSQLLMAIKYPKQPYKVAERYDGVDAIAVCFPDTVNVVRGATQVIAGRLHSGKLNKGTVKMLIHYMWKHSPEVACEVMSDMQRLANAYLLMRGVSVGIWDCLPAPKSRDAVQAMLMKIDNLTRHVYADASQAHLTDKFTEPIVASLLASAINYSGQVCQSELKVDGTDAGNTNTILAMVESGSKGSMINIAQLMGVVGQQFVDGRRIQGSLPCFAREDNSAAAHGFVAKSFMDGLRPAEFFYHAMGGREGLVDTSVKTATTGYIQRKLIKGMESCQTAYDGTVRNSNKEIIQFTYGGDNMDATNLVRDSLPLVMLSDAEVGAAASPSSSNVLLGLRDDLRRARRVNGLRPKFTEEVFLPFNAAWIKNDVPKRVTGALVTADWYEGWMQRLLNEVEQVWPAAKSSYSAVMARAYVAWHYRFQQVDQLTKKQLKWLANRVVTCIELARVAPMEMVGNLAAEMCGEPATQLTLNSFHTSGNLHAVNQGVPRLDELLSTTKSSKTPTMCCPLKAPYGDSEECAYMLARCLPQTKLHQIVNSSAIVPLFGPDLQLPGPELASFAHPLQVRRLVDLELDQAFKNDQVVSLAMHFTFNTEAMLMKDMTPQSVLLKLHPQLTAYIDAEIKVFDKVEATKKRSRGNSSARVAKRKTSNFAQTKDDNPATSRSSTEINFVPCLAEADIQQSFWLLTHPHNVDKWELVILLRRHGSVQTRHQLESHLHRILEMMVCGIQGITAAQATRTTSHGVDPDTGGVVSKATWSLFTAGSNIVGMSTIPMIDMYNLASNELFEVWNLYGLEAAAKLLYYEIKRVLSFDSSNLHDRHIMLIVHTMTRSGELMAMNRHGINKQKTGPLIRASFEQPMEVISDAAMFGEEDNMCGVSENIIMGNLAPIGTGGFSVMQGVPVEVQEVDTVVCSKMPETLPAFEWKPLIPSSIPTSLDAYNDYQNQNDVFNDAAGGTMGTTMGANFFSSAVTEREAFASSVKAYCPSSPPLNKRKRPLVYCPGSP